MSPTIRKVRSSTIANWATKRRQRLGYKKGITPSITRTKLNAINKCCQTGLSIEVSHKKTEPCARFRGFYTFLGQVAKGLKSDQSLDAGRETGDAFGVLASLLCESVFRLAYCYLPLVSFMYLKKSLSGFNNNTSSWPLKVSS